MSTLIDSLPPAPEPEVFDALPLSAQSEARPEAQEPPATWPWSPSRFAEEQIRLLVRQVFFPGWPKPARHVIFSAVDRNTYVAEICMEVGKVLASQVSGSVCLVEANFHNPELENIFGEKKPTAVPRRDGLGSLRSSAQRISSRLWLAPLRLLLGEEGACPSSAWLERRLSDFRLEFDYTILHAPPAGLYSETAIMSRLHDGVALVLEANITRRLTAQKAKEMLQAANAKVLGTVLSERSFPIPESLYRKL